MSEKQLQSSLNLPSAAKLHNYPKLLNMSQEKLRTIDRAKGRSLVEGNINMYPKPEGSQDMSDFEEKSQVLEH